MLGFAALAAVMRLCTMALTLLVGVLAFTFLYAWLLIHRFRLARLEELADERRLAEALAERRAEGATVPAGRSDGDAVARGHFAPEAVP